MHVLYSIDYAVYMQMTDVDLYSGFAEVQQKSQALSGDDIRVLSLFERPFHLVQLIGGEGRSTPPDLPPSEWIVVSTSGLKVIAVSGQRSFFRRPQGQSCVLQMTFIQTGNGFRRGRCDDRSDRLTARTQETTTVIDT